VPHLHLALGSRPCYSAEMKIRSGAAFVLALLLPTISVAQGPPVAVPGTADTAGVPEKPVERQITDAEQAKAPVGPIFRMSDLDAEGNGVMITSASIHVEDGQPVWYIGAVGTCLRGVIATPKQQGGSPGVFREVHECGGQVREGHVRIELAREPWGVQLVARLCFVLRPAEQVSPEAHGFVFELLRSRRCAMKVLVAGATGAIGRPLR
jgi:hypothetical protein